MFSLKSLAAATLLALSATASQAVAIGGLVNTGAGLSAGAMDTNYAFSVISGNATSNGYGYAWSGTGFPSPYWAAPSATSTWLTPSANAAQSYDMAVSGTYLWTTTFDLGAFDPATASFDARVIADNGVGVYLNGHLLMQSPSEMNLGAWMNFSSGSGANFVAGMNTLQFVVNNVAVNGPNPTGLRVEYLSSNVGPVPEPQSWAMMLAGLAAMGFVAGRRRAS